MTELDVASAQERFNLTPYEVLDRRVAHRGGDEGRRGAAQVARVIYNRLSQGIPLGHRRHLALRGRAGRPATARTSTSRATRRTTPAGSPGLPPTPIAAPGRASIEAALNPADGPWIYYVLEDAEGNHFFTDSDSEFLAAKERCREAGLGCG